MAKQYLGAVTPEEQKKLNKIMKNPLTREKAKGKKPLKNVNLNIRGEKPA